MKIAELHASNWAGVCYVTGGGTLLLSDLLCEPGASATILNAAVPYSNEALAQLLGHSPDQACSEISARNLAMKAFSDAKEYSSDQALFGLGVTASLQTNHPKRGALRAYIAIQTATRSQVTKVEFSNSQTRKAQEILLAKIAYGKLCSGLGIASDPYPDCNTQTAYARTAQEILFDTEPVALGARAPAYLPGAFNPMHSGHCQMRQLAQEMLQCDVQYELSVRNVDKLPLDYFDLDQRCKQFQPDELLLTNLPYFYQKAKHLSVDRRVTFVVGVDTFARIIDPKFYQIGMPLHDVVNFFIATGTNFLVFGRTVGNKFMTLADLSIPPNLRELCRQVEAAQFQCELASSTLRSNSGLTYNDRLE